LFLYQILFLEYFFKVGALGVRAGRVAVLEDCAVGGMGAVEVITDKEGTDKGLSGGQLIGVL
jgi:hypothetical protein